MNIQQLQSDVLAQRADEIREYFHPDAYVNWHCSNEHFTVEEFIRANCEYPGDWDGEVGKDRHNRRYDYYRNTGIPEGSLRFVPRYVLH